ncbi:UNKNOWN [Stylonychia lemnae]|uniref:EF-hand domain-containing protein n=1 Tax=Stylonychia lemnae TaxID=5949 RepID=A0A078A275_STYLE|nr:UNKNOWN [Stylonychia lemnae]|eukprot:CDW76240.1 UNKNOWN [Stylonychia lemnae]
MQFYRSPTYNQSGNTSAFIQQNQANLNGSFLPIGKENKMSLSNNQILTDRCKSASVGQRIKKQPEFKSPYQQTDNSEKLNDSQQREGYQSSMCVGSKLIIEKKAQDTQQRENYIKEQCFQRYGGKDQLSMIDVYIQNQNNQKYFTPGIQKFEENLVNQLKKLKGHEEPQQKGKSALRFGNKTGRQNTIQNLYTRREKLDSSFHQQFDSFDNSTQADKYISRRQNKLMDGARGSLQHIYYNGGIPKTLLKKKSLLVDQSNNAKNKSFLDSSYLNQPISKDKLNFAKAKWLRKHGVEILVVDSKESEEESRKLFRYIDFGNDGVISKQQIRLFIKFLEGELSQDELKKSPIESNHIVKQLKKLVLNHNQSKIDENTFSFLMTKVDNKSQNRAYYNKLIPHNNYINNNNSAGDIINNNRNGYQEPLSELIKQDPQVIQQKMQSNNLARDAQQAIDQLELNKERTTNLKVKLDQILTKCKEMKTLTISNKSSIQNTFSSQLNSNFQSLNIQQKSVANNSQNLLRDQELVDLNRLFKKLQTQIDRFEQHSIRMSQLSDFERLQQQLEQFGVQLNQVERHIKQEEIKLKGVNSEEILVAEDLNFKQLKNLNQTLNRRAVMNKLAKDFDTNALGKQKRRDLNDQKDNLKYNWQSQVQQQELSGQKQNYMTNHYQN